MTKERKSSTPTSLESIPPELLPKNPEILKLLKSLETMPEYLEEQRRKRIEHDRFITSVWEDACRKAGLIK